MKMWVICQRCGFKEKKELISRQEAIHQKIPIGRPCCSKCNNINVKMEPA